MRRSLRPRRCSGYIKTATSVCSCHWQGQQRRLYATEASLPPSSLPADQRSQQPQSGVARYNEIGIQQLSSHVYPQVFPQGKRTTPPELVELSKKHLTHHNLLGKNTDNAPPIAIKLPKLQGTTLDEHFHKLGIDSGEPYLTNAKRFARTNQPAKPRQWVRRSGWTKYWADGRSEAVETPDEDALCFDCEVMWKESPFAVMACAMSPTHWYAWISPWLLEETDSDRQLIPLGDPTKPRIVVGHNIGYDRARVREEYDLKQSKNFFVDTMSLHVAVNGMCSRQRPTWLKHKQSRDLRDKVALETDDLELAAMLGSHSAEADTENLWVGRSSVNSLRDVARFHLGLELDKSQREYFGDLDRAGIREKLDMLLSYCAADVAITHRIFKIVFPNYLKTCPHSVSFAALRHLSNTILPVDRSWDTYIANAEATYKTKLDGIYQKLIGLCRQALELKENEAWRKDPWLCQLDWTIAPLRMVKGKKKNDPPVPSNKQKMPGEPAWWKELHNMAGEFDKPLSVRTRLASILLRLEWDGHPLVFAVKHGFGFVADVDEANKYIQQGMVKVSTLDDPKDAHIELKNSQVFIALPHLGQNKRCMTPMAKFYKPFFEAGTLKSDYDLAKVALEMNASCSYWISARDRITSQMVIYAGDLPNDAMHSEQHKKPRKSAEVESGFILPQLIPMGTITRRAVENTWLTASNAKVDRVGSELKSMVRAPKGYSFVGADVDSQELWIASLLGDSQLHIHGGNAVGFMTLEGTKSAGTDMHSRTAGILGISRNDAKVFNYGRIYGAGQHFAGSLLRQFNPSMSTDDAARIPRELYAATKGIKTKRPIITQRYFWRGGTESLVFNKLEDFAEQDKPRTPALGAGITEALMAQYVKSGFMTSRINWAIQSSGVDYLHLLIVSMDYLIRRYNLEARLAITVHDEIRYLVKDEDRYRVAMALQVSILWTRAMFAQQVGINDLPQSCAYFSAVDIDHVLRKEVDMDCITPSNPTAIKPGISLDITELLNHSDSQLNDSIVPNIPMQDLNTIEYTPRVSVMQTMEAAGPRHKTLSYLRAQLASDVKELNEVTRDHRKLRDDPYDESQESYVYHPLDQNGQRRPSEYMRELTSLPLVKRDKDRAGLSGGRNRDEVLL